MRVFIAVLVLIFSFQSWTRADDISDFEIEGISIGDSLLDYYSEKKIINTYKYYYPKSKKFIMIEGSFDKHLEIYEEFYVTYKDNGKFIIHEIKGVINFKESNECIDKRDKIAATIRTSFKENIKDEREYIKNPAQDNSGKSKNYSIDFDIEEGKIRLYCQMWSEDLQNKKKWVPHLAIVVYDNEFRSFLMNDAYE